jgi:hypothetical protein
LPHYQRPHHRRLSRLSVRSTVTSWLDASPGSSASTSTVPDLTKPPSPRCTALWTACPRCCSRSAQRRRFWTTPCASHRRPPSPGPRSALMSTRRCRTPSRSHPCPTTTQPAGLCWTASPSGSPPTKSLAALRQRAVKIDRCEALKVTIQDRKWSVGRLSILLEQRTVCKNGTSSRMPWSGVGTPVISSSTGYLIGNPRGPQRGLWRRYV